MKKRATSLSQFDGLLAVGAVLLVGLGLIILYSLGVKARQVSNQLDTSRQIIYALIGVVLMVVAAKNDYKILKNYSKGLYIFMIVSLLAVEFFGVTRLGATRWIALGPFQFQPSEVAKLIVVIMLAKFYGSSYNYTSQPRYLFRSLLLLLPPLVLVLIQPDLGTAIVLFGVWLSMTLATRVKKRYLVALFAAGLLLVPLVYPRLATYQKQRIATFFNPAADPSGTGYNVNQAIIAVGSGGWFGQGLGSGSQSQGSFLPSSHTDFIFAVLCEKLGFLGALVAITMFVVVIVRIFIDGTRSQDRFGSLLCIGIGTMFLLHVFINIGMNLGIMPVTGIPLPFISAGGTSLMISLLSIGIVQSVYMRRRGRELQESELV